MDEKKQNKSKLLKSLSFWIFLIMAAVLISSYISGREEIDEISYSAFRAHLQEGRIDSVEISEEEIEGMYVDRDGQAITFKAIRVEDPDLVKDLREQGVEFKGAVSTTWLHTLAFSFGPILLFILLWLFILNSMKRGGRDAMKFGRSRARMHVKKAKEEITFNDVAGLDETKEELQEIVEYLKRPEKFTALGAKIPKGVLLYGPPGTGKTLLTKAIAGEAEVPFFSTSGSEFVEMFVGVGASRIRDLFDKGRRSAPCIIFIDELDAVGRSRFSGLGGGHDEREQTLNQILKELDGFDSREGVILIGATNRPDVLDPALLRKGRFDRHIAVPRPNSKERQEIFELHSKAVKIAKNIKFEVLARRTPGFTGSDIANIINEAALLAARDKAKKVTMHYIEEAIDRIIAGPKKKSRVISEEEKKKIAYHESGHTLVAFKLHRTDPVHKVSILSRGTALGYTLQLPVEDRHLVSEGEILDKMAVLLSGRSAEELIFGEKTTGAQDDLRRATEMAYKLVAEYGMSDELGAVTFQRDRENIFLGKELAQGSEYSQKTAELIDRGAKNIIEKCHEKAADILKKNRKKLETLAKELIKREEIEADEISKIINGTGKKKPAAKRKPRAKKKKAGTDEKRKDKKSS